MDEPEVLTLADGRVLAYDDVGDPHGVPVVYLHGTPDSRLGRPPDDGAARAGVRLLALDRPGAGDSDPHLAATLTSLGHDVEAVLDHEGIERAILLGWSSGGLSALAAATVLGRRAQAVGLVAPLPPVEAYADADLVSALGPGRRLFVELARDMPAAELAAEVAPHLVPRPLTPALALEHVLDGAGVHGRAELAAVAGASERLAEALAASVRQGTGGIQHDIALQMEPGVDLAAVSAPVRTFHGGRDEVSPPVVGAWLVARLPHAVLDLTPEGSHHLLFPRWQGILGALRRDAAI